MNAECKKVKFFRVVKQPKNKNLFWTIMGGICSLCDGLGFTLWHRVFPFKVHCIHCIRSGVKNKMPTYNEGCC